MSAPLSHRANIVAELVERLGNVCSEDDGDFLASALTDATADLEKTCLAALREARQAEAYAEAIKAIIADNKARKDRLEARAEKIRAAVAQAMAEAGLPKIVSADLTVSFRMSKPSLVLDSEPNHWHVDNCYADMEIKYSWDKKSVRDALDAGVSLDFARLGNPAPVLTLRSK